MAGITLDPKQARIVHALTGPVFVSAGAGAGKTLVLTQRVLHALTPGSKPREQWANPDVPEPFLDSIDQVLAITFTTKAAQELKQRVRRALTEEGLDAQAERVEDAWFSTIHGMCSRIIRSYALDLDVDPGFKVAEYADGIKREAVEHVLRDAGSEYQKLLSRFKIESDSAGSLSVSSLMAILSAILNKVSSSTSGLDAFEQVTPKPSHRRIYEAYRAIAESPTFKNAALAQEAVAALDAYLDSPRDMPALRTCYAACDKLNKIGATAAEKEFQGKIVQLEEELRGVQTQINELQRQRKPGEKELLSSEQRKVLSDFRKKEVEARKELKLVRRQLRAEIDSLENTLIFMNIALMPILVIVAGITVAAVKRRRSAHR